MTPEKMTIDELINAFQGCDKVTFTLTGIGEKEYETADFKEAIEDIEKALEKQIPQPTDKTMRDNEESHDRCPECGGFAFGEYCVNCGQHLLWEVKK